MEEAARSVVEAYIWVPSGDELQYLNFISMEEFHDGGHYAVNMEEALEKSDYLFVFRAVQAAIVANVDEDEIQTDEK